MGRLFAALLFVPLMSMAQAKQGILPFDRIVALPQSYSLPITDLINASEEFPMFFLLASIDLLSLKYRTKPSSMMINPVMTRGVPTIFQNSLSTR